MTDPDWERGNNWVKFDGDDNGYPEPDQLELIISPPPSSGGGSFEISGECSDYATIGLTLEQLKALRDFLQEVL